MINSPEDLLENGTFKKPILSALKSFLFLKTNLEIILPVHNEICELALAKFKPIVEDREVYKNSKRLNNRVGKPINKFTSLYLASDTITHQIYTWHKAELNKRGFKAEGDFCPFLVAENTYNMAENLLIDVMSPYTGIEIKNLYDPEKRKKYVNIVLGLLISLADKEKIELNIIKEVSK